MSFDWRSALLPASFRGVPFKVAAGARTGGRRLALHEFPKRDEPYAEDMGRRGKRFAVSAYVVGDDFKARADALAAELDREGPGTYVHPTMGPVLVKCEAYTQNETKDRGRVVEFEIQFVEAGSAPSPTVEIISDTNLQFKASALLDAAASDVDAGLRGVSGALP